MTDIDSQPLHPKRKIFIYMQLICSPNYPGTLQLLVFQKTWVSENIDFIVNGYMRKWLDIPISETLVVFFLSEIYLVLTFVHYQLNSSRVKPLSANMSQLTKIWSGSKSNPRRNIFNFTVR